jgi:hypothetical protein
MLWTYFCAPFTLSESQFGRVVGNMNFGLDGQAITVFYVFDTDIIFNQIEFHFVTSGIGMKSVYYHRSYGDFMTRSYLLSEGYMTQTFLSFLPLLPLSSL